MRRTIALVLVAALALAVGMQATASAAAGTQAAAKKKAANCKAKPKKGKAGSAAAKKKAAKCKAKPKAKSPAGTLVDGHYEDAAKSLRLTVSGGGKKLEVGFPTSCFLFASETVPIQRSGDVAKASYDGEIVIAGIPGHVTWELTVKPGLKYSFTADFQVEVCAATPTHSGVLKKKG